MNSHLEDTYLEAEEAIRNSNYPHAKHLLESIIMEEPNFVPAHNSLGWLYRTQLDDYKRAENHFLTALNTDRYYPHTYNNLFVLYTNLEDWTKIKQLGQRALTIPLVDKALVFYRLGIAEEYQLNFEEAIKYYKKAIQRCLNFESLEDYKKAITNCEYKLSLNI
ncbi:tetratricopeptide repeat protein [Pedobacter sp. SYSU D00535]|uniref:tetratricopeptide repeat protein n=1 Tax=Pedobacter sp. SYSU D00535 TaxID=2810308 RepID=UPI001A96A88D|nr:tetratricopeptide repeat protein [Pedobacter sp. SYSU D00535]